MAAATLHPDVVQLERRFLDVAARAKRTRPPVAEFQAFVLAFYRHHGRRLPWRRTRNPYHILVAEIMLQQTQVPRVVQKYPAFLAAFPTLSALAAAPLAEILRVWRGMGYNRRALALKRLAGIVITQHDGAIPRDPTVLMSLPGIGAATAASVAAFAFNAPHVFLETNIRTVFIHYFFQQRRRVTDAELSPLVAAMLDHTNPRRWYNALMDLGTWLKTRGLNRNSSAAAHRPQSAFVGSTRELRGRILALLTDGRPRSAAAIARNLSAELPRVTDCLAQLQIEGFLCCRRATFVLAG
jgi:A/G-specific adenine glycosylase